MVTVNLIKYNLFSATGGPNLYGTEPWHFYLRNLALNFNVWLPLALLSLPVFLMSKFLSSSRLGFSSGLRVIVFLLPFYLWLAIFSLQPHKEERFMYPVYPFLAVNAAICLHVILSALGSTDPSTLMGKVPARLKLFAVTTLLLLSADLGLARIYGLYSGYSAPLKLYAPLGAGVPGGEQGLGGNGDSVCFGKDWYRLPTSYFLPRGMHARFVRSGFRGLLPGDFAESRTGFGFWSGTWLPTIGLNDRNEEDPGRYVDVLRECRFLVDTQYPERQLRPGYMPDPDEPDYVADTEHWEVVKCIPFLDAESTHVLARALWLPEISALPEKYRRRWGRHCLLRRRDAVPAAGGHGEGKQS